MSSKRRQVRTYLHVGVLTQVNNRWMFALNRRDTGIGELPGQRLFYAKLTHENRTENKSNNIAMVTRVAFVSNALRAFARKRCIEEIELNSSECAAAQVMAIS